MVKQHINYTVTMTDGEPTFGDYTLECEINRNWSNTGIFASAADKTMTELHIIVTNKFNDEKIDGNFVIYSDKEYTHGMVYYVSEGSNNIKKGEDFTLTDNSFRYSISPMSVGHIVIKI